MRFCKRLIMTYQILTEQKITAIIHFAASAYVGESMRMPSEYFQNNVSNGLKLLSAARRAHVDRIVFSSSCATYGVPEALPVSEDHPQVPINPYGESKLFMEKALRWYGEAYGIRSVCLRYFNAAERTRLASSASATLPKHTYCQVPSKPRLAAGSISRFLAQISQRQMAARFAIIFT